MLVTTDRRFTEGRSAVTGRARIAVLVLVLFGALLAPVSAAAQADPPDQPRRSAPTDGVPPAPAASAAEVDAAATMTYTVTNTDDGGSGSLREAFSLANSDAMPSIILLSGGTTYELTSCGPVGEEDANANGDLDHTDTFPLTIRGAGEILGDGPDGLTVIEIDCGERVIHGTTTAVLTIESVRMQGGNVEGSGGGISSEGPLVLRKSALNNNTATLWGGGAFAPGGATIEGSAVLLNAAAGDGAGGIDANDADVAAVNSLFFFNTGGVGSAIFGEAITLHSSTILYNETTEPLVGDVDGETLVSTGSALLGSVADQLCSLDSTAPSGGHNFAQDNSCGLNAATDVIDTVTPIDEVLGDNLGPVAGGPLHNKVPVSKCSGFDVLGQSRPQGTLCDIGAVEYPSFTVPPIVLAADPLTPVVVADVLAGATTPLLELPLLDPTVKVPPSKGTAVLSGNQLTYTADGSDDGVDTFFLEQCEETRTDCVPIEVRVTIASLSSRFFFTNVLRGGAASAEITFGKGAGDEFFVGDFDGDGVDDLAKREIGSNVFTIRDLDGVAAAADTTVGYGRPGDQVFVGDWDGNGTDTFAVRRGNQFFVKNSISPGPADMVIGYGKAADEVFVGDWDADGDDTFAVRRGNVFFVRNTVTTGPADNMFGYGRAADVVLVGDWDANGSDTFAVRRGNVIFVRNDFLTAPAEFSFGFGRAADELFPGDWNNDGLDTFAVRRIVS